MKPATHPKRPSALERIHVLLVDDHPAVRQGLALLLAPEDIVVSCEAGGRADALVCLEQRCADLAILDLSLDGEDGLALIADLRRRAVPVLVYSMHDDPGHVRDAIAAGALGYVTKRDFHSVLVQAIREVAAGRRFVSPNATGALLEGMAGSSNEDPVQSLSAHERKVYELLGGGDDIYDIAAALGITPHTVESYYSRILVKLNLSGMHGLRRHAIAHLQKHTT